MTILPHYKPIVAHFPEIYNSICKKQYDRKLLFTGRYAAPQLTIENGQLTIMVSPSATYFNHFRRKYRNCQLSIVNYQFARMCAKQQFTVPLFPQTFSGRVIQHFPILCKSGAVAGTIPGALVPVPFQRAAQVGAAGRCGGSADSPSILPHCTEAGGAGPSVTAKRPVHSGYLSPAADH